MAENFIAEARVVVVVDTKKAKAELAALAKQSKQTVPVRVTANTAGFAKDLNQKIASAKKQVVRVPVTPNMAGFLAKLRTDVKAASDKVVARVRVEPNMTGFQGRLQTAVSAAASKVTARVPVTPVAAAGAARQAAQAAPAGGTKAATTSAAAAGTQKVTSATIKATAAEKAFAEAEGAASFARKRVAGDMTAEERRALSLQRELAALAAAEKAVTRAITEQNPVLLANALALQKSAEAAVAKRQGTIAKSAAPAQRAASVAAAAEAEAAAGVKAAQAAEKEKTAAHKAALADNVKFDKAAATASAKALTDAHKEALARNKELDRAAAAATQRRISGVQTGVQEQLSRPSVVAAAKSEQAIERIRRRIASATEALNAVEIQGAGAKTALSAAQQRVNAAETVAIRTKAILSDAEKVRSDTILGEAAALNKKALAEIRNQAETLRSAAAEEKATKVQSQRFRGFGAQIATFAGLRGAVLAANAQFIAGTVAAIAFGKAVSSAASFESQLNVFKVTAGATADEMARVSDAAKSLGRDVSLPAVSAGSAAQAMTELSKAGLSVEDSINGARGVLQLATAAQIDNAQATQFAASALNAFGLAGADAVHVADVLTNAANASQGSIADMAIAMQQASAVARQVGISFEDTVGFLTLLSKAGIQGSDAGTSLRVAFTRLINPTDKAQKILSDLNVQLRDAQGNIRPQVFTDFAKAQSNLSKKQQDANAAVVFGTDALRAYSVIARAGVGGFAQVSRELDKQGSAAELAAARMQGLTGAIENLKNQLSNLGLVIGNLSIGPLKLMADTLAITASNVSATSDAVGKLVGNAKKLGKAFADNVPQIKVGPLDTKEADKTTGNFLKSTAKKLAPVALGAVVSPGATLVALDPVGKAIAKLGLLSKDTGKEIQNVLDELNVRPDLPAFNEAIVRLQKLQHELAGGTKEQQKAAKKLGPFISQLQKLAGQKPIVIPFVTPKADKIKLPTDLGGKAKKIGSDAGQGIIDGLQNKLSEGKLFGAATNFFDGLTAASTTSGERFVHSGELTAKEFGQQVQSGLQTAFLLAVNEVNQGTQALTNAMNEAIIAGAGTSTLRGIAQKQLANALKIVDDAKKRLAAIPKTEANKARRKKAKGILDVALETAAGATGTVKGFTDQIASDAKQKAQDAKQKAQDAKDARDKADQAILDAFSPREAALDLRDTQLADSTNLKAILKAQKDRRALLQQEIAAVRTGFNDKKAANAEIAKLRVDSQNQTNAINATIDQINQQTIEGSPVLQAQISLAQAQGNIPLQIKLIDRQITNINNLVKKQHLLGAALNKAKAAREGLKQQREDLQNQAIEDQIALGQSIFDLTGNKNQLLKALNAAIAETRADIKAAKKAGKSTTVLQTELNNFLKQRKDVIKGAADQAKDATTAFDLLKQGVETFNASAGNLIFGDQPFAGPAGFNADIAQFLKFQGKPKPTSLFPGKAKDDQLVASQTSLRDAILSLKDSVDKASGNTSTAQGVNIPIVKGNPWAGRRWFSDSQQSRWAQES